MQETLVQRTLGEDFLLSLQNAESKGVLLANLEDITSTCYPRNNLVSQVKKLSDFESVAKYQAKLARLRIEYNARAVKDLQSRLIGLNNFGNDNYKYKDKVVRKLNLLINNNPTLDDMIYLAMSEFVSKGWGSVADFKNELETRSKEKVPVAKCTKFCGEDKFSVCEA